MKKRKNKTIVAIALTLILTISTLIAIAPIPNTVEAADDYGDLLQYEWPAAGATPEHTHFSAGPAPNSPDILFQKDVPGFSKWGPIAFDGKIFIIQNKPDNIVAMDPFTGNVIWNITVPGVTPDRAYRIASIFKVDATRICAIIDLTKTQTEPHSGWAMRCFNTADGALLWSSDTNFEITFYGLHRISFVPAEKMLYVAVGNESGRGGTQGAVVNKAWDFSDPTQPPTLAWKTILDGVAAWPTYGDGKIFPGSSQYHQTCLDAKTGEILWETDLTGAPSYAPSYYDGKILRGCLDNSFYALDGETGEVLWKTKPSGYGFWASGSAAAYGMVYESNVDGYTYALNVTNGQVVWKYWNGGQYYPGYIDVADGKVYACTVQSRPSPLTPETSHAEYACLDAFTGKLLWRVDKQFGSGPSDATCIAYGNFYGVDSGVLYCYGPPQDWSMFLRDPEHTATGYGGPVDMSLSWKFTTDGAVISSPAVVGGKVYVGSWDKNWYCLDARTGDKIWNFTTNYRIRSSPAVVDGKVYTGADDGWIYCLDANTGSQLWKVATPGYAVPIIFATAAQFRGSPTVVGGKVYVGSLEGKLYCLNAINGDVIWELQSWGAIISTPTVIDNDGVYFASRDGFVYKVNALNGNIIWNTTTPIGYENSMMSSPAVGDGKVFIGAGGARGAPANIGQFYCLDAATGDFIWTVDELPGSGNLQPIWSMLYLDGKVYYGDFFSFTCSNATTGEKLWSTFLTREHYGSPAYADGKFYVPSDSYGVYVVDAETGEKLSYFGTDSQVQSSPAIYESKLYFGSVDFNVYCVEEASTGTVYYGTQEPQPSPTPQPTPGPQPTPTPSPSPSPSPLPSPGPGEPAAPINMYLIAAAVAVVAVIVAAAIFLRKRK